MFNSRDITGVNSRPVWRVAGLTAILLGLGTAVVGLVIGLTKANEVSIRILEDTRGQAHRVARLSQRLASEKIDPILSRLLNDSLKPVEALPLVDSLPAFIEATALLHNGEWAMLQNTHRGPAEWHAIAAAHLAGRMDLFGTGTPLPASTFYAPIDAHWSAALLSRIRDGSVRCAAVLIDSEALAEEAVKPLLKAVGGLQLTRAAAAGDWAYHLAGPLSGLSIMPMEEFVAQQRNLLVRQTWSFAGLTLLVLIALLSAMWVLFRTAQREVALAEMKSSFAADVSHELKTPLALIHMFCETLQSGRIASEERRQDYYRIIMRESTRLTNLINNILDFARIDAGRKEYTMSATDVSQVVRETYESYTTELDRLGFEHRLTIGPGLPTVPADCDAITQVLVNLISNAVKYSGDEKWLHIDVTRDTRRGRHGVLVSVHDRGIGIEPADRLRLFEGFYRSGDARVRQQRGAGLGLTLVKSIVDAHDGTVDVEPRLVRGTTFRVFLPASEPESAVNGESTAPSLRGPAQAAGQEQERSQHGQNSDCR